MRKKWQVVVSIATITALIFTGCGKSQEEVAKEEREALTTNFSTDMSAIKTGSLKAGVSDHDPSILEVDGTYYIYGSHMTAAKSTDLRTWTTMTNGFSKENKIYGKIYGSEEPFVLTGKRTSAIPTEDGTPHIWAPDVKYSEKAGKYYMYYCTSSNYYTSTICYATSDSPEGPFEPQGNLLYSGFNEQTLDKTNVLDTVDKDYVMGTYLQNDGLSYDNQTWPNCIDPTIFWDKDGKMWMVYGSWSGGIFLLEINEETGEVIHPEADPANNVDPYYGKRLIGGGHTSIEAPYIVYDEQTGFYYLYVSYGSLTRTGGYQIRCFRSDKVDGSYVDMKGKAPAMKAGSPFMFGIKMSGNYMLPSQEQAYMASGHNSALIASDGKRYICSHVRFEKKGEFHEPRVHQILYNEEGWPCMLPYPTNGETVSGTGYSKEEVTGEYFFINQGTRIDAEIAQPEKIVLTEKGNAFTSSGDGTWEAKKDSYQMKVTIDGTEYSGVFCKMKDEAGTEVMVFSAVGENESVWGVKYFE